MSGMRFWKLPLLLLALATVTAWAQEKYEWKDNKWVKVAAPVAGTAGGDLAILRELVEAKKGRKAIKAAEAFLATHGDSKHREEVLCLAAQAELDRGHLYQAFERFEQQIVNFPNGEYLDRALNRQFEIAERFLAGEKRIVLKIFRLPARSEGLDILARVAEHAPGADIAERALIRIGDYYFDRQEYADAANAYDGFLSLHAKSKRAPYAMLRAAHASFRSFKDVAHDDTPLIDAQQRYRTFAATYPQQAAKEGVEAILKQIDEMRAEKLFTSARFYERVRRTEAAAFYYKEVASRHPGTSWADRAREALLRLGKAEAPPRREYDGPAVRPDTKAPKEPVERAD